MVTNHKDENELVMFSNYILGSFYFKTFFGELDVELSSFMNSYMQSKLLPCTHISEPNCILVDASSTNYNIELTNFTF